VLVDRLILVIGDVASKKTHRFLKEQKRVCLPKPFTLGEFRDAIQKGLAGS
jgi:hypothetical protein